MNQLDKMMMAKPAALSGGMNRVIPGAMPQMAFPLQGAMPGMQGPMSPIMPQQAQPLFRFDRDKLMKALAMAQQTGMFGGMPQNSPMGLLAPAMSLGGNLYDAYKGIKNG